MPPNADGQTTFRRTDIGGGDRLFSHNIHVIYTYARHRWLSPPTQPPPFRFTAPISICNLTILFLSILISKVHVYPARPISNFGLDRSGFSYVPILVCIYSFYIRMYLTYIGYMCTLLCAKRIGFKTYWSHMKWAVLGTWTWIYEVPTRYTK